MGDDDDDEGWSFVVSGRFCVGSETGIDTDGSDSVTTTDSVTTVSTTGSGIVICRGILMKIFLSMLTNLWNCASKLGLARLNENGTLGLSSGFSLSTATFSLKSLIRPP